jgi:hypothetical protein
MGGTALCRETAGKTRPGMPPNALNGRASKASYAWSTPLMLRRHMGETLI